MCECMSTFTHILMNVYVHLDNMCRGRPGQEVTICVHTVRVYMYMCKCTYRHYVCTPSMFICTCVNVHIDNMCIHNTCLYVYV